MRHVIVSAAFELEMIADGDTWMRYGRARP